MKPGFSICLLVSTGLAQTVSFGLRAGVPITDLLSADRTLQEATRRYTVGPTIELHVTHGFALSADFLYQRFEMGFSSASQETATVHRWELPVMWRREFGGVHGKPFVGAGVTLNHLFTIERAQGCARGPFGERFYCIDNRIIVELRHQATHGPVIGSGVQFRWKPVRFIPEIRLMHWADRNFGVRGSAIRSNLTEAEILLGIMF